MGERVDVVLTVLKEHLDRVIEISDNSHEEIQESVEDNFTHLIFSEVNYGNLDFLYKLQDEGIAYTSEFDAGSDWSTGQDVLRFTPEGEARNTHIYESDYSPNLTELIEHSKSGGSIDSLIEKVRERIYIPPWDNQAEWGKIYRLKQMLVTR